MAVGRCVSLWVLYLSAVIWGVSGLTIVERQQLLDAHNQRRGAVDPSAQAMMKMQWSHELETMAQITASKCVPKPTEQPNCTNAAFPTPGQNTLKIYGDQLKTPDEIVEKWIGEKSDYNHTANVCLNNTYVTCNHYKQVVSANVTHVGCVRANCSGFSLVVCDYGPIDLSSGDIYRRRPYEAGSPCSACGTGMLCDNNLCVNPNITYTVLEHASPSKMLCLSQRVTTTTTPIPPANTGAADNFVLLPEDVAIAGIMMDMNATDVRGNGTDSGCNAMGGNGTDVAGNGTDVGCDGMDMTTVAGVATTAGSAADTVLPYTLWLVAMVISIVLMGKYQVTQ